MTPAQLATLKAYVLSVPALAAMTSGPGTDYGAIAAALSAPASPVTKAWLTQVTPDQMDDAPDYSTFDSIVAGKRDSWGFLIARNRDFTRNKTRKWITDIWGNATAGSNSESILQAGTENANVAEVAIGGNSKTTGTVTALARNFIGSVSINDVADMFRG